MIQSTSPAHSIHIISKVFFWSPFPILWCIEIGKYHKEDLAKFSYRPNMNVENFKNPFIFWLPARNLFLEECGDFCNKFFGNLAKLGP
jgi:hypothetical protein